MAGACQAVHRNGVATSIGIEVGLRLRLADEEQAVDGHHIIALTGPHHQAAIETSQISGI